MKQDMTCMFVGIISAIIGVSLFIVFAITAIWGMIWLVELAPAALTIIMSILFVGWAFCIGYPIYKTVADRCQERIKRNAS